MSQGLHFLVVSFHSHMFWIDPPPRSSLPQILTTFAKYSILGNVSKISAVFLQNSQKLAKL